MPFIGGNPRPASALLYSGSLLSGDATSGGIDYGAVPIVNTGVFRRWRAHSQELGDSTIWTANVTDGFDPYIPIPVKGKKHLPLPVFPDAIDRRLIREGMLDRRHVLPIVFDVAVVPVPMSPPPLTRPRQVIEGGATIPPFDRAPVRPTVVHPDRHDAVSRLAALAMFQALSPRPERTSPIAVAVHPDQLDRKSAHAPLAPFFSPSPTPERTSPVATVIYPDRLDPASGHAPRAWFYVVPVSPERTSPLFSTTHPDRLEGTSRAWLTGGATAPVAEEAEFSLDAFVSFPDRLDVFPRGSALAPFFSLPSQPERTVAIFVVVHPDRLDPTSKHAPIAPFVVYPVAPERTSPLATTTFPDRLDLTSSIHALAPFIAPSSIRERTTALATVVYPDRLDPSSARDWAPFAGASPPAEEEEFSLDAFVVFPDRLDAISRFASIAPFVALPTSPERTSPLATAVHPDRLDPSSSNATLAWVLGEPPAEGEEFSVDFFSIFPDRLDLLSSRALVLPFVLYPVPERTAPLAVVVHPDRVASAPRVVEFSSSAAPTLAEQLVVPSVFQDRIVCEGVAFESFLAIGIAPELTAPFRSTIYPDRLDSVSPYALQPVFERAQLVSGTTTGAGFAHELVRPTALSAPVRPASTANPDPTSSTTARGVPRAAAGAAPPSATPSTTSARAAVLVGLPSAAARPAISTSTSSSSSSRGGGSSTPSSANVSVDRPKKKE